MNIELKTSPDYQRVVLAEVLAKFGVPYASSTCTPVHGGLINSTWKIESFGKSFILQQINHQVFREPFAIANNIELISEYLSKHHPEYLYVHPVHTENNETLLNTSSGYYRMMPFVENSKTIDVVRTPAQAYEAAKQFGKFTRVLQHFDRINELQQTIPDFHNLSFRFQQFQEAVANGNSVRVAGSQNAIRAVYRHTIILDKYQHILRKAAFQLRVTHHDTKISNVLFNPQDQGICVIDPDTTMAGYFFSDFGDMMRTYLCPVSEEEADFSKIEIRAPFYQAICDGYLSEMQDVLNDLEKNNLFFAGQILIYMQALRFLTDHLNNDIYYGAAYPDHNLVRAENQLVLLDCLLQFEKAS